MAEAQYKYLERVASPDDLKRLSVAELKEYVKELRAYIVECCATNPGHLGSSLGAVELTVALHYVYDTPNDRIVWDVGHQAYAHKIITGRREAFKGNRTRGGISGFPRMEESRYDAFGAGHSSVSISAAFGMAKAIEMQGGKEHVVAVIGDGAMTGGLAFEGLNNAGASPKSDLLVVLNDNEMSIDKPTGALDRYLVRMSTSRWYNSLKRNLWKGLGVVPPVHRLVRKTGNAIKQGLLQNSNLFESLNFRYFGPVDGHNIDELIRTLRALKDIGGPKLLHIKTIKGKGYAPAEGDPATWHAPGRFDVATGERVKSNYAAARYQDVFGETLLDIARRDCRVVGITPAMPSGCSMNIMMREMPDRCFDVGIAEGHAVTFSAGMAAAGHRPVCNIYSSFMQRAYDNVIHDIALQNLPVVLCLDRAGLVGEDGATHHGAFDLAYFSCVPNLVVAAPRNEWMLRQMLYTATQADYPTVIRYPRGIGEGVEWQNRPFESIEVGRGEQLREGNDVAIITIGTMAGRALRAAERSGASVAVYDMRYAKPLDTKLIDEVASTFRHIITIEDGIIRGGVGEAIAAHILQQGYNPSIVNLGIDDRFVEHGKPSELYADCGYDEEAILEMISKMQEQR
ncbi:MAG: 1-deoxy-D-xylulose-5-phosphate synthase [Rikenellaceae bacterium]|nr:1-deoxy-D-xylulose-5-phosphate synthase [Rikenellaceae bacterium]